MTSTGSLFSRYGWYSHSETALITSGVANMAGPDTYFRSRILPSFPITKTDWIFDAQRVHVPLEHEGARRRDLLHEDVLIDVVRGVLGAQVGVVVLDGEGDAQAVVRPTSTTPFSSYRTGSVTRK